MDSSKLSSTLDVDSEEFNWAELERDLYHWTKVLRPVQVGIRCGLNNQSLATMLDSRGIY